MRAPAAVVLFLTAGLSAGGCSEGSTFIIIGDGPPSAQSFFLALEQETRRLLYASDAADQPLNLGYPESFEIEQPTTLTRVWLAQPFSELLVASGAPLSSSSAPNRTLESLVPLLVENGNILNADVVSNFVRGEASPWILGHRLPRPIRCPRRAGDELISTSLSPRDLQSVTPDLAVGISGDQTFVFRADGTWSGYPHRALEPGRALAVGPNQRVWVVTASSAAVLDLVTGAWSEEVRFTSEQSPIGFGEDPDDGSLYLLSDRAVIWRRAAGASEFTVLAALATSDVRLHSFNKSIAHFLPHGGGRLSIVGDQIAGIVEIEGDEVFIRRPEMTSEGFSTMFRRATGELVLADSNVGGLFVYEFGALDFLRASSSGIVGVAPIHGVPDRYAYLTSYALLGGLDLSSEEVCPESVFGSFTDARGFAAVGERYVMSGLATDRRYGWWWVQIED